MFAAPFLLLLDPDASCLELGERLNEFIQRLQLPVEAIQKECEAWYAKIDAIRDQLKANRHASHSPYYSSYSQTFYNGFTPSSHNYNASTNSTFSDDDNSDSLQSSSTVHWKSSQGRLTKPAGCNSVVKPHSDRPTMSTKSSTSTMSTMSTTSTTSTMSTTSTTSTMSTKSSVASSLLQKATTPLESESSSDEPLYFNEDISSEDDSKAFGAVDTTKTFSQNSPTFVSVSLKQSTASSNQQTEPQASSSTGTGLLGGSSKQMDDAMPEIRTFSGSRERESTERTTKGETEKPMEGVRRPSKDQKIESNLELKDETSSEKKLPGVSSKQFVELKMIERENVDPKLENSNEAATHLNKIPIKLDNSFSEDVSSDEEVYVSSESPQMEVELGNAQSNSAVNSSEAAAAASTAEANKAKEMNEMNEMNETKVPEWKKSAPFLPVYHVLSMNSSIEPDHLLLCNDPQRKLRSRIHTYSSITTIALVVKCITTSKMTQPVSSTQYYDYTQDYSNPLQSDPLWSKLYEPLVSLKLYDFEKEKAALGPENQLSNCLNLFSMRGNLDNQNKWFCPCCQTEVCAENRTLIDRLPDVLILQLERFGYDQSAVSYSYYSSYSSYSGYGARRKISTTINFPLTDLDMKQWLHDASLEQGQDTVYDLVSICNHSGTASGGHYYCFAKDENNGKTEWMEYNDSSVSSIGESELVRNTAYVLFYQRRKSAVRSDVLCEEIKERMKKEEEEEKKREEEEEKRRQKEWEEQWSRTENDGKETEREKMMHKEDKEEEKRLEEKIAAADSWPYDSFTNEDSDKERGKKNGWDVDVGNVQQSQKGYDARDSGSDSSADVVDKDVLKDNAIVVTVDGECLTANTAKDSKDSASMMDVESHSPSLFCSVC